MVLGDSISAAYGLAESSGWVHLLATALKTSHPQSRVVNASVSGETTTGGLQRLPDALNRFSPDIVIIELGGNDGLRGQSLELMRSNLSAMIALTIDAGAKPILVGMRIPPNYGKVYADGFHQTFIDVATEKTIPLVPFLLEPIAEDRRYFQPDGIHPTAEAQPLLLEQVLPTVDTLMSFTE
ncbi:MAG: arylesterase [Gammaproteobacteria bacterium]|nr:arylesterase [Gammaproteobacteria bacterium]